jgi:hypothetical protein
VLNTIAPMSSAHLACRLALFLTVDLSSSASLLRGAYGPSAAQEIVRVAHPRQDERAAAGHEGRFQRTMPVRMANTAAWTRFSIASLPRMLATWFLTVFGLM